MNPVGSLRISVDVKRAEGFEIVVDDRAITAYPGETVAAAMLCAGLRTTRSSALPGQPRGFFCGMGVCWECAVRIDGTRTERACMERVRPGIRVDTSLDGGP